MSFSTSRSYARVVTWLVAPILVAGGLVAAGAGPASAKPQWGNAYWSPDVRISCPKGKFGYFYIDGGHVSYKRIYWKPKTAQHWSNTLPTGYSGQARLIRVLYKKGGGRTARAYFGAAPDSRHGMSPRSRLDWRGFCSSKNLYYAENADSVGWINDKIGVWKDAAKLWERVRVR